jgi:hypothetical protein
MARQEKRTDSGRRHDGPENTLRLRLKRKAPVSGHVEGAWWPHSGDLSQGLPDLLPVPEPLVDGCGVDISVTSHGEMMRVDHNASCVESTLT